MDKNQIPSDSLVPPIPLPEAEVPPVSEKNPEIQNLQKIFKKSVPDFAESTDFHRGPRSGGRGYQLVAWSFIAATIDALILFSMSCFFLFALSLLVKSQMISVLQVFSGSLFKVGIAGGALAVWTYMIMLRVFLGFTIGEWACGLRLGSLKQRLHRFYSLRVLARMLLIFATGLFTLPLLSILTGRDLPGLAVRLPLVQSSK
jgi:hypothetical protein